MSQPQLSNTTKILLPWLVAIAFFMEGLDATILNTGVPMIASALRVTPLSMKSVLSSYTLSLAVFIPISSWVADRFGTRRVFSWAIGVFTFGSLLCGLCSNIHLLVASRILQGCGGAMMVPVGRLTLVRAFPKSELVRVMSYMAIPALIGPMLGPLVGGFIVGFFHWRLIFFVNIPIGLLGLYFVQRNLPNFRAQHPGPLDWTGTLLFGAGIAVLSYVLEVFGEHTLNAYEILGLLGLAVGLIVAYAFHARLIRHPVLRLDLLRVRTLRVGVTGNFVTRLGVGGMPFLLPLLYQIGLGYTPMQSGLLIMPQSFAALALKMTMPKILIRFGFRKVLLYNTMFIGLFIFLFATVDTNTPAWLIVLQACCFGFFSSTQYTCMNTLVYADVSEHHTSMASTIVSTVQQMSMSFGVATASLVTAFFLPDRFHSSPQELLHGMHHAFSFLAVLTVLSALGFQELRPEDGEKVSQHKALPVH